MSTARVDLAIVNGTIVSEYGTVRGDIYVDGSKIVEISTTLRAYRAERVIDAEGKLVFPGVIDSHVHLVSSAANFEQNCRKETVTMALGGVTTALTYLIDDRRYSDVIREYQATVEVNSTIDLGFHLVMKKPEHLAEIARCAEMGVPSFKFFIGAADADKRNKVGVTPSGVDDGFVYESMGAIGDLPYPALAMVHAENWEVIWALQKKLREEGRTDQEAWSDSRPDVCEEEAVARACLFAARQHCTLYVDHLSSRAGLEAVNRWRSEWPRIYVELTPHHLTLTKDSRLDVGVIRCNPPLRTGEDVEALWSGVLSGKVNTVASDHIPGRSLKGRPPNHDVWAPPLQMAHLYPGSSMILPIVYSEGVVKRGLPLERLVQVCSSNPARIFGLGRKGSILPGADADLIIFDPREEFVVTPEKLQLSSDFSWYEGWKFRGWPTTTILRGEIVMQGNQVLVKPGFGRYLPRHATGSASARDAQRVPS